MEEGWTTRRGEFALVVEMPLIENGAKWAETAARMERMKIEEKIPNMMV